MQNKAIFFDRDGVINKLVKRNGNYFSPMNFKSFKVHDDVKLVTQKLKTLNFINIVISNQPDIARNLMDFSELELMTNFLKKNTYIDDIFYCLHDDSSNCLCRKPKTGLFKKAQLKWDIDLSQSLFIGDTWRDLEAGKNLAIKTIILENNCNSSLKCDIKIKKLTDLLPIIQNELY